MPVTGFRSDKARSLLAYLAMEGDRAHARPALATLFWPDVPEATASQNLRQTLSRLRQALDNDPAGASADPPYLLTTIHDLRFNPASAHELDVVTFVQAATQGIKQGERSQLEQAVALYSGELLHGFSVSDSELFEEWLLVQREQLQKLALDALSTLTTLLLEAGDSSAAQRYAHQQLALDSWRESAHRQLIEALAASGQRSAALLQYETCRRVLLAELGVEPEAATTTLFEQIRTGVFPDKVTRRQGDKEQGARGRGQGEKDDALPATLSPPHLVTLSPSHDWSEAPDLGRFYGRVSELATLERWLLAEGCRLVALVGMGGAGKTALAAQLAQQVAGEFDVVIWRSLLNAPPLPELLLGCLRTLSSQQLVQLPTGLDAQLELLINLLRERRCLLVLDNLESLLQGGVARRYRDGYADYGQLLQRVGQSRHRSCLLLTSREEPPELGRLAGEHEPARLFALEGLTTTAGKAILQDRGVEGIHERDVAALVSRYSGNALALKLVAETIRDLFAGDIQAFLQEETPIFDDIRAVLDEQFARLAPLEQQLLTWLAIEREPVSLAVLQSDLLQPPTRWVLLEAARTLRRHALLETHGDSFTLQNVLTEYVSDYLVDQVCQEILDFRFWILDLESDDSQSKSQNLKAKVLNRFALLKAEAKEYVRQSQARQIMQPVAERLVARLGRGKVVERAREILATLRNAAPQAPGYAAGNLLNLLLHLGVDVTGFDFSNLAVWQAYLRGATLHKVNFAAADLAHSLFSEVFSSLRSLTLSADGQLLAVGTEDDEIRLWWLANRQLNAVLKGVSRDIRAIAFSPDGATLASSGENRVICLWDVSKQSVRALLAGHANWVWSVAFSPDGAMLASGSADRTIRLWDVAKERERATLRGHSDWVCAVAFSLDGTTLASGSKDFTIRLWDLTSTGGTSSDDLPSALLSGHTNGVTSVAFSSDGSLLASGSEDNTVRLWEVRNRRALLTLQGHTDLITSASLHPAASRAGRLVMAGLVSGGRDGTVRVWDLDSGQLRHTLHGHTSAVTGVAFTPDGTHIVSGSLDQSVRIWDAHTGQALHTIYGYTNVVLALAFSPDGRFLASGGSDQSVRIWDIEQAQMNHTLTGHSDRVKGVAFSADGTTLASLSLDQTVRTWSVQSGRPLGTFPGSNNWLGSIIFTPAGQLLVGSSADESVHVWEPPRGQTLHILREHTSLVKSVAFSADGRFLASGSWDQTVCVWALGGQTVSAPGEIRPLCILRGHEGAIESLAFSPDGSLLASGSWDHTVHVWALGANPAMDARRLHVLRGHTAGILAVAFMPTYESGALAQSTRLASASDDGTLRLWDMQSGEIRHVLLDHSQSVTALAFTPDGQLLASGSTDQTIKCWDVESGVCLQTLRATGRFADMNITGVTGITEAQRAVLKALGAVDET
jgi:WD40 repeat protein/DNA-binding SARP family transcriptional activator